MEVFVMKRNILNAFALALAAVLAAVPLKGCGFAKEEDGATLEIPFENSYRSAQLSDAFNWSLIDSIGNYVIFSKYASNDNRTIKLLAYNAETGESKEFPPAINDDRKVLTNYTRANVFLEMADGKIGIVCNEFTYNMNNSQEDTVRRCIEIYDADWNLVEVEEIPEDFADGRVLGTAWNQPTTFQDSEGNWFVCDYENGVISTFNSKYQKYGEIRLPSEDTLNSMFSGADGGVYAFGTAYDSLHNENITHIYRLNAENRTTEELNLNDLPEKEHLGWHSTTKGSGEYLFYYWGYEGLYGVKADGGAKQVVNWLNSDFRRGCVIGCVPLKNGKFLLRYQNDNGSNTYWIVEERTQEELDSTQFMTLSAVDLSGELEDAIIDYNRQENGWRIMLVDYEDAQSLRQDMLDGITADIICTENLHFENLASKGLFADWYDLMDADDDFNREEYLQNFFTALEYDGKLLRLAPSYRVETYFAKTEYAPKKDSYTAAEFMDVIEAIPKGMQVYQFVCRENALTHYLPLAQQSYVNWKTGECGFDSPEFVRYLEWAKSLPAERIMDENDLMQSDYDFQQDRVLLYFEDIAEPIRYHMIQRAYFRDAEISLVGYPAYGEQGGNGGAFQLPYSVSVNAQSKHKDAIWLFMEHLLTEDYQKRLNHSLPIHTAMLEEQLETAMDMSAAAVELIDGTKVNVGAATQEEMDTLRDYICGIGQLAVSNQTVGSIIQEESEMFLAGDCTAQECAEKIQSRVSLYLSEQS